MHIQNKVGFSKSRKKALITGLLVAAAMSASVLAAKPAHASTTFMVNANFTDDPRDIDLNDDVCDASPDPGIQCTLRAAIEQANATAGPNTINFNFLAGGGVGTISPQTALPSITDPITIDGYSQPGAHPNTQAVGNDAVLKVQLNGTNLGASATDGLVLESDNNVVRGLVINRFGSDGVEIRGGGNKIEGNFIGTDPSGTEDLGNGGSGVNIRGSDNNTIGDGSPGGANIIAFNGGKGVSIEELGGASATGNRVLSNSIFSNDFLGIDLNGDNLSSNDPGDADSGPNNLQNYPELNFAVASGSQTFVSGTLESTPGKTFEVQVFSSPQKDPSGFGEGQTFLGEKEVTTDSSGKASFFIAAPKATAAGSFVTATATSASGDTSEFSEGKVASPLKKKKKHHKKH